MLDDPFLKREYVTSIHRGDLFRDRILAVVLTGGVLGACLLAWDWKGWDRESVAGAALFARVEFCLVVMVQACLSVGFVLPVSRAIAAERDRKTLDALLATRLTSARIVLGVMAAGLLRFVNATVATLPVVVLVVYYSGIDLRMAILVLVGSTSTAIGVAALSVVASVESRTGPRATRAAVGLLHTWFVLPALILLGRPLLFPVLPTWLIAPVLVMLDAGPLGLFGSYVGILPRPWGIVEAVARMCTSELAIAGALMVLAVCRLRPASRALYDLESRQEWRRTLGLPQRRPPRRRPCGANPVFWLETYDHRAGTNGWVATITRRLLQFVWPIMLLITTWWFAAPAFIELIEHGYGASAQPFRLPESNPLTRVIAERLILGTSLSVQPGMARLEFNLALRQFSAMLAMGFLMTTFTFGVESVTRERDRETWIGLLSTPLSAGEIVHGKVLGAVWRNREGLIVLLALWAIGLATGAIHPLGFLASLVWLGACAPLYGAMGVSSALRSNRQQQPLQPASWPLAIVAGLGLAPILTGVPLILASATLVTYDEVQAMSGSRTYPFFVGSALEPWVGAKLVGLADLAAVTATIVCACSLIRLLLLSFDSLVGRPCRTPGGQSTSAGNPAAKILHVSNSQ